VEEGEGWREGAVVSCVVRSGVFCVVRTYRKLTHDGKERHKRRKEEAESGDRDGGKRRNNRSTSTHANPTKRHARVLPANRQAAHSINRKHYHALHFFVAPPPYRGFLNVHISLSVSYQFQAHSPSFLP